MNWIRVKQPIAPKIVEVMLNEEGISLPPSFYEFLGPNNGGGLREGIVCTKEGKRIPYARNLSLDKNARGNAFVMFSILDGGSKRLFPFGSVGNGDYFCIDTRNGKVILLMHDPVGQIEVSDDFNEFLRLLSDETAPK